jgi:hypothetical protein
MPSNIEITAAQLSQLVGLPDSPILAGACTDEDYNSEKRLLPNSCRKDFASLRVWAHEFQDRAVIVSCQNGLELNQGVAASFD